MVAGGRNISSAVGQRLHNSLLVCDGLMRFKREISFRMGGFAIDLICKLTVFCRQTDTSRKDISWFVSLSTVNWIDGSRLFR